MAGKLKVKSYVRSVSMVNPTFKELSRDELFEVQFPNGDRLQCRWKKEDGCLEIKQTGVGGGRGLVIEPNCENLIRVRIRK